MDQQYKSLSLPCGAVEIVGVQCPLPSSNRGMTQRFKDRLPDIGSSGFRRVSIYRLG